MSMPRFIVHWWGEVYEHVGDEFVIEVDDYETALQVGFDSAWDDVYDVDVTVKELDDDN